MGPQTEAGANLEGPAPNLDMASPGLAEAVREADFRLMLGSD